MLEFEEGEYSANIHINNSANSNAILLTGWNEYTNYFKYDSKFLTISSLYSYEGALILLRNIFRNPKIKTIVVLNDNPLGKTIMGKNGIQLLYNIFFNKLNIEGFDFDKLRKTCELFFVNDNYEYEYIFDEKIKKGIFNFENFQSSEEVLKTNREKLIIKHEKKINNKFTHSEYSGFQIHENNLFISWYKVLSLVNKYGKIKNNNIKELHSVHWSFTDINISKYEKIIFQENIQTMIGLNTNSLKEYSKIITENINVTNSAYTYGERLSIYHDKIIENFKKDINTRHAYATTILYDKVDIQPPCLVFVQFLFDDYNKKLNLYCVFRSHDIFKGALSNGYGLGMLLEKYAKEINVSPGLVEITSISAHIYKSDLYNAEMLINCVNKNVDYEEDLYLDPRGTCVINKKNGIFTVDIYNKNELCECIEGTNFEVYNKLLERFNNIHHLKYLFNELFKE